MNILFLAHRTPYPPDKGDKIRSFNLLSQLSKRHRVSLAYWVDDPRDLVSSKVLTEICRGAVAPVALNAYSAKARALLSLFRGRSFTEGFYYSRKFRTVVEALVKSEQPDIIYVFSSAMSRYADGFKEIPKIVDFVDVDSDKWGQLSEVAPFPLSVLYRRERSRLAAFEIEVSRWANCSLFVSESEADLFRKMGGAGVIASLPNGVDFAHDSLSVQGVRADGSSRPIRLLFVGQMNYLPNSDAALYFAREILPKIRQCYPDVVFEIVGRCPPRPVLKLHGRNGIRVFGEVKAIEPFLAQADVSVAPLRIARGVQNKVLEAMAMGVPVVATSEAVQGIRVAHGQEVLLGDGADSFARQVIRLLADKELRTQIANRARKKIEDIYNWSVIGNQLDDLLQHAAFGISKGLA